MKKFFKRLAFVVGIIALAMVILAGIFAFCYYMSPTADKLLVDVIGKQHPVVTGVIIWKFDGHEIITKIPGNMKPEIKISEDVQRPMVQFFFDEDWLRERTPSRYAVDLMEKNPKLKRIVILEPKK